VLLGLPEPLIEQLSPPGLVAFVGWKQPAVSERFQLRPERLQLLCEGGGNGRGVFVALLIEVRIPPN